MTKRTIVKFWVSVVGIQLAGWTLDFIGGLMAGSLDSLTRLLGLMLLFPGIAVVWEWMDKYATSLARYEALLGVAMAINMAVAGLILFSFCWTIRIKQRNSN
jgi:hypothetical protein